MARNNKTVNINNFLKKSLQGQSFLGRYMVVRDARPNSGYMVVDSSEVKFIAELEAVDKMMSVIAADIPETDLHDVFQKIEGENTIGFHVSLKTRGKQAPMDQQLWEINSAVVGRNGGLEIQVKLSADPCKTSLEKLTSNATWKAIKEFSRFTSLFAVVLIFAITEIFKFASLTVVKVVELAPRIIDCLMPLFLAIIEAFTKCFGGLLYLIAILFAKQPGNSKENLTDTNRALPVIWKREQQAPLKRHRSILYKR